MKLRRVLAVTAYNYRQWHKNSRVIITFGLCFILCFLLSDKAVRFSAAYQSVLQLLEPFVWTFGDAKSILLSSLLLILLFADVPFIGPGTPYYLLRMDRRTWLAGQLVYILTATLLYLIFVLLSTALLCSARSFPGNMWSETAAILGYSKAGKTVALPALVKTLEMSTPYECTATIFLLMLLYSLLLASVMLLFRLTGGAKGGVLSGFGFSLYGLLLNPRLLQAVFNIPPELGYKANVAMGWLSPLNHAAYHMHNFGYDRLPRLWQTYGVFLALIALCCALSLRAIRKYDFRFTGTEG